MLNYKVKKNVKLVFTSIKVKLIMVTLLLKKIYTKGEL
jgi:hypothetical protein